MLTRSKAFIAGTATLTVFGLSILYLQGARTTAPRDLAAATVQDTQQAAAPLVGADRGPQQPIAYSHRLHAGDYGIECLYCHTNADRSAFVPIPSVATCMGCHQVVAAASEQIQLLRGYQQRNEPIPWVRIHKLADFVQFNHARHVRTVLSCQDCHGPIQEMDVVYQFATLTMGWCLECHWQPAEDEKRAEAERIGELFAREGWESHGLYPKSIDSDYGVTRAPIDCVACHY